MSGAEEPLTEGSNNQRPFAVSPDERHLIFGETTTDAASNLMLLTLDGLSTPEVLLSTPFDTARHSIVVVHDWFESAAVPAG